jgi:hypothetical protein
MREPNRSTIDFFYRHLISGLILANRNAAQS